ncbi:MAG: hypothetical protein AAGJ97_14430, partial [Planctomycetota bacterium]
DEFAERLRPYVYVAGRELLDLPPNTERTVTFDLSDEGRRVYDAFADEVAVSFADGKPVTDDGSAETHLTADNPLVKLLRLQQLTGGTAVTESVDGRRDVLSVDSAKQHALRDVIASTEGPWVVFCVFREDLVQIKEVFAELGHTCGEISGTQLDLDDGCMPGWADAMAVQIQSGGVGVDLTRARVGVFWQPGLSLANFVQAQARYDRPGQTRPTETIYLAARRTIDEVVYRTLASRGDVIEAVLAEIKNPTPEHSL